MRVCICAFISRVFIITSCVLFQHGSTQRSGCRAAFVYLTFSSFHIKNYSFLNCTRLCVYSCMRVFRVRVRVWRVCMCVYVCAREYMCVCVCLCACVLVDMCVLSY